MENQSENMIYEVIETYFLSAYAGIHLIREKSKYVCEKQQNEPICGSATFCASRRKQDGFPIRSGMMETRRAIARHKRAKTLQNK